MRAADLAPEPRTLVDIFTDVVSRYPEAPAIDNGVEMLTYADLNEAAETLAAVLADAGVARGDRVGVRITSGTTDLYTAILGILFAGAAYVPVDVDDPEERARTVFGEAAVAAVLGDDLVVTSHRQDESTVDADGSAGTAGSIDTGGPSLTDDAWIIFTSGSTGTPKGVAVSHRSAAAFVDAEAELFLQSDPLRLGDRVMAGLSVAFDASCEEMWLAWRYGACLVPAPRSLVRSGMDLGPWLVANRITVVSTVPTLVSLWPPQALDDVRLLIVGGEACPPELGARYASATREVWNTYGPTEATVVSCAARLTGEPPVRIGLPLAGWDLAVVDDQGMPVPPGGTGELIIGGVGLARYLDPAKDAEKYAPMPSLGWDRAYRSGDLVRYEEAGLLFAGRIDDQIKLGGRRIELGEIDSALMDLPGVNGAAAAVRKTSSGNQLLVGYLTVDPGFDATAAVARLRESMPAALVPRLAPVDTLPTRTSGKIDRDALPWPVPTAASTATRPSPLTGTAAWVAELWADILAVDAAGPADDFFDLGGASLTAAQLVARLRERYPEATVADVYEQPTIASLAAYLDALAAPTGRTNEPVHPVPLKTQIGQVFATFALRTLGGMRWLTWISAANNLAAAALDLAWLPTLSWWWVLAGWLLFLTPPGRVLLTAALARIILRGVTPGTHPRGGKVHLRLWLAERVAEEIGVLNLSGAPLMTWYARTLGATVERGVDLHTIPPITGMLTLRTEASVEAEVDLNGYWLDGHTLYVGRIEVGPRARIGARSMVLPGSVVGAGAEIGAGSLVSGEVPAGEEWSGSPATRRRKARGPWEDQQPPRHRGWQFAYGLTAVLLSAMPVLAVGAAIAVIAPAVRGSQSLGEAALGALAWLPPATVVGGFALALLVLVTVRAFSIRLQPGPHPVHGRIAWQVWSTLRVLDEARTWLFPLYASWLTPTWLRLLGARIGKDVEASTVLLVPSLTTVADGAFLADDTLLGGYELGGGWLRAEHVKIGKRAFVGNSGMTAPGRKVPKRGLVAVLSAAPRRTKAKSGTSWLGSPPTRLRRSAAEGGEERTYAPPTRLRVARALVEACRVIPVMVAAAIGLGVVVAVQALAMVAWWLPVLTTGLVLIVGGAVAAGVTVGAKWLLIGKVRVGDHPLWSTFVWRNELADTFTEVVAAPWFARATLGTPVLNVWLRLLGAKVGRGVWCESYWLPEMDLVELRDGVTVNPGCVVQTHLFHDRVLSLEQVTLRVGATLGTHSVILPSATLGRHATVGPMSLVMRGESVPDKTRWIGNPIGPWVDDDADEPVPSAR
ncbi:Pls/PosA family non-ribosomal peptide synthetase [Occultella kanbiaonis]|uniref:Pls/PosA family non-ribosomal peptide synthetase n=1 Tax=Occultella kanbiaonis TaxID=2675754 RepID=UPI0012B6F354|nr:Pls/PosA family non-ribosomal peptide synthetase [Occultella kanbiaonis]